MLLYGPSGAGKMTRIRLLLQEVFDSSISKVFLLDRAFFNFQNY
jgi:ABC-type multidrug transport system ATPase subunit